MRARLDAWSQHLHAQADRRQGGAAAQGVPKLERHVVKRVSIVGRQLVEPPAGPRMLENAFRLTAGDEHRLFVSLVGLDVVDAPEPSMMNLNAAAVCRCAVATLPGQTDWIPAHSVWVVPYGKPGFTSRNVLLSPPRSSPTT